MNVFAKPVSVVVAGLIAAISAPEVGAAPPSPVSVRNPTFTIPNAATPAGSAASTLALCPVGGAVGSSASADWTTYGNTHLTSIGSWLLPGPDGDPNQLISTGGAHNGLVQVLAPQDTVTDLYRVDARVFVVAGRAGIQIGNGGSGGGRWGVSEGRGAWEELSACGRADRLNNEIVIYGLEPSVFYVDDVRLTYDAGCECSHTEHSTGELLSAGCNSCVASICALDPYCCSTQWDALCVSHTLASCSMLESSADMPSIEEPPPEESLDIPNIPPSSEH